MRPVNFHSLAMVFLAAVLIATPSFGGKVKCDMTGDWKAVFDTGGWGTHENVLTLTTEGDQFVGVYKSEGDQHIGKGEKKLKGTLRDGVIEKVWVLSMDHATLTLEWADHEVLIQNGCKKVVLSRTEEYMGATANQVLTMTK